MDEFNVDDFNTNQTKVGLAGFNPNVGKKVEEVPVVTETVSNPIEVETGSGVTETSEPSIEQPQMDSIPNAASPEPNNIENNIKNNINEFEQIAPQVNEIKTKETDTKKSVNSIFNDTKATGPKKIRFKYQIINSQGSKVKGYIDAYTKEEVQAYLENEGYQIVSIAVSKDIIIGGLKLKYSELAFILTQLSTYLKSGITLIDAVRILEKQSVDPYKRVIFSNITYELVKGESFSSALEQQSNVFPKLLINMVKTSEMTGDLPTILDDMTDYYTTVDRTKKAAVSAMIYPTIIFIFSIMVITFILTYVIPNFVSMFEENNATVPTLTKIVIAVSNFLTENGLVIIGIIAVIIIIYTILFKKVKSFRKAMQSFYMRLPIISNMIIYKEVAMFTKTFASLLNHDVFITDSMAILSQITTNEVYADIIHDSLDYLSKGAKISDSFKGKWAFPIVAYEMLLTGENTGRLPIMMDYVAKYYDDLHTNYTKRLNTFIEPIMIVFLALIVGIVVLAVVIPMFSFYSQIQ